MGARGIIVNLEGQNIHYEKYGTGTHHIFLMPGALGSSRTDFSHQLDNFDREKFTIIAWDPPGYGYSRPHDRQFPIDFFHQDANMALKLLKHLNISKTSLIGWSDGGMTALILASQNPDLVEKLVVFGSVSYFTQQDLLNYEAVRDINKWDENLRKLKVDLYGEEYTKWMWNVGMSIRTNIFEEKNGEIVRNDLKLIKCPTLILHGKNDLMVPRTHPIFLKENIPNSKFVEWADASHNLHIQFVHRFNYVVENFLLNGI